MDLYTDNRVLFFEENWNLKVKAVTLPLKGTVSHYALHIIYVCIVSTRIAGRYAHFLLGGPFLSIPARSTALSTLSTAPFKIICFTFLFPFFIS